MERPENKFLRGVRQEYHNTALLKVIIYGNQKKRIVVMQEKEASSRGYNQMGNLKYCDLE